MHRSDEHFRCADGVKESLANHRSRGHSLNLGDTGLGVLAVGVAAQIHYGSRYLLFNCALPGHWARTDDVLRTIGPALVQLVNMADHQRGSRGS